MTKSQNNQAFNTASGQNQEYNANAQSTYNAAQGDIGQFQDALSKYAAENPYVQGGQFQTSQNQALADTAAAQAQSAGQGLQAEQVRSGQNPAGAIAATEQMNQNNTRQMMQAQDAATQQRLAGLTQYDTNTLNASAKPEEMEAGLMNSQLAGANSSLGQETDAAKNPSFWQQLGAAAASGLGKGVSMGNVSVCYIAAALWGGWGDRRTVVVRLWLTYAFSRRWYGPLVLCAYRHLGRWVGEDVMPRSLSVHRLMEKLFARALACAEEWVATAEGGRIYSAHCWLEKNRKVHDRGRPCPKSWYDWAIGRAGRAAAEVL